MEDKYDDIIFFEELRPERQAEVRAALEDNPELARAFAYWRTVRAAVRERMGTYFPDRRLLVLYALDEAGQGDVLAADERRQLSRARPDIEEALDRHPGLQEAVRRIQEDQAIFETAWDTHRALDEASDDARLRERADRSPRQPHTQRSASSTRRWIWPVAVAAVIALVAVLSVVFVDQGPERVVVVSGPEEERHVELDDGSTVRLMAGSQLVYAAPPFDRAVTLEGGRAFFEVAPAADPFVVETPTARTTVLGTSFGVQVDEAETQVVLAAGQVEVASRRAPEQAVRLAPGQASRITEDEGPTEPTAVNVMDALAWTGLFVFRDTPMDEIAERLGEHYETTIIVEAALRDEAITGTFDQDQPLSDILQTIAATLDAQVVSMDDGYRIEADGAA